MNKRRRVVDTWQTSTVVYPSVLFSLEKDEVFPYERLAYNLLDIGVEALHARNLPECLTIDFTQLLPGSAPWTINARVTVDLDERGAPKAVRFATPELAPAIWYMFASIVASDFDDEDKFTEFRNDPIVLRNRINFFVDGVSAAVSAYQQKGLGFAIRASYDRLGLTISDLPRSANYYDLLTKQIAFHEVAHAYIQQVIRQPAPNPLERRAFELIADLVAAEWFYNKMVKNTPDSEEYRSFRGVKTHRESIFANSLLTLRSQQANLILMAIAGAQRADGLVSLAGGETHPPGLQRYMLQHMHLYTLIGSNFSSVLLPEDFEVFQRDWDSKMNVLAASGAVPIDDLREMIDPAECDTIEAAAELIVELAVPELMKMTPSLRSIRDLLSHRE